MEKQKHNIRFIEIYTDYYKEVLSYLTMRLGSAEDAEDVIGVLFTKIDKNLPFYDPEKATLKTWIYTSVKNAIIDHWRKKKLNTVNPDGYVNDEGLPSFDFVSDENNPTERAELHEEVMFALNKLKENERNVVKMFYLEEYKQDEIAEILELSVTHVKQIIFRTKDKLQVLLKGAYSLMG